MAAKRTSAGMLNSTRMTRRRPRRSTRMSALHATRGPMLRWRRPDQRGSEPAV